MNMNMKKILKSPKFLLRKSLSNKFLSYFILFSVMALLITMISAVAPFSVSAQTTGAAGTSGSSGGGLTLNLGTPPSLIVCGTTTSNPCTFASLITLANAVITWMIWISVPLALVGISYAGWLYLTDTGNESNVRDAKKIFSGLMWGFIWLLVAYAVIYTIVNPLLNTGGGFQLFNLG
jgi:hypothetical protein